MKIQRIKLQEIIREEIKKILESKLDNYYIETLMDYFKKQLKAKINGWEANAYTDSNGQFLVEWTKDEYRILATPFWNQTESIQIELYDDDDDILINKTIPFKTAFTGEENSSGLKKDLINYVKKMKQLIPQLEKKM